MGLDKWRFFVLERSVLNLIDSDGCGWEEKPLRELADKKELNSYHLEVSGNRWILYVIERLEELWASGSAPWKTWNK